MEVISLAFFDKQKVLHFSAAKKKQKREKLNKLLNKIVWEKEQKIQLRKAVNVFSVSHNKLSYLGDTWNGSSINDSDFTTQWGISFTNHF